MTLFLLVLLAALAFEYINGFHDTANAIATVVSTKVLTPRAAIIWAAFWNLIGALAGTAVAKTISGGLVEASAVDMLTVFCALFGAIIWWWCLLAGSACRAWCWRWVAQRRRVWRSLRRWRHCWMRSRC